VNQPLSEDIDGMIETHCEHAVTWEGWQAIDAVETAAGEASAPGRPRVKLTDWAALRDTARQLASHR
jgi:hypothetical protein